MNLVLQIKIFLQLFIQQLLNPLTYVLLFSAAVLVIVGTWFDALVIIAILIVSAILGAIQEYRVLGLIAQLNLFAGKLDFAGESQAALKNNLNHNLKQLSYFILGFITVICLGLLTIGLLTGKHLPELLTMLTGLFICAVPEGLPLALKLATITAAAGYQLTDQAQVIFYKFRRVVLFFFATNLGEILVVFGALVLNLPIPILASQFLWLNLVTDGLLSTALAVSPVDFTLVNRNLKDQALISRTLVFTIIYRALLLAGLAFGLFYFTYQMDLGKARTLALLVIVFFQISNAWICALECNLLANLNFITHKYLIITSLLIIFLQVGMVYWSFMQVVLGTVPISIGEWLLVLLMAIFSLGTCKISKAW